VIGNAFREGHETPRSYCRGWRGALQSAPAFSERRNHRRRVPGSGYSPLRPLRV